MDTLSYKTTHAKSSTVQKEWILVDATDAILGRFCSRVAVMIMGKHKPSYTPHVDTGANIIVINADPYGMCNALLLKKYEK